MKVHVLDANALYRLLTRGPGFEVVNRLMKDARDAQQPLRMSVINWGEVYSTIARTVGFAETDRTMERVELLPLAILGADQAITTKAGQLKAGYGLPYADCFAAASTPDDAVLVTADAKDFRKIPGLQVLALPEHKSRN
jgi:predicted nucleic acid-binding protein